MIERTLVLLKPDCVQRGLMGKVISRYEDAGLKIVGMKMAWADKSIALEHYTEDIAKKHGQNIRDYNIDFLTSGPVIAIVIEGSSAIENVRKITGETEPKKSLPGTIRGDFSHVSYLRADGKKTVVRNIVHASGNKEDAKREIALWFSEKELHTYKTVYEIHTI